MTDALLRQSLRVLQHRLQRSAADDSLLDVAYRIVDSPVGRLLLAGTPHGLVRVAFESEDHDVVLQALSDAISPRVLESATALEQAARELGEYFDGRRRQFTVPTDLTLTHGFRRNVIAALPSISYGTTATYAQVAQLVGNPRAVRAVGSACSHNPLPLVIPCHRVIRSDGSVGAYLGGAVAKEQLLTLERA